MPDAFDSARDARQRSRLVAALHTPPRRASRARALPVLLRFGHGASVFPPQVVPLYTARTVALATGMRLAFSR
jgi:hypothetical protein